ncbi:hypothetical protein RIF23_08605 [Lipingzhangella sp. LS1_29]|uniref:Uncharacterized protein n=1 Tax=Lipingzhangella rawalii TaxID=2055835 RepID=A0ABU2H4Y0_9ACTN|nr:hypothetical protein [Lipingzhangella rawalii]MDS1270353.1 hypothetical protein [Lipingzhangella rawalii]
MSNSPLYLAIVLVWIIVLVPMLLRRDVADTAPRGTRRPADHDTTADQAAIDPDDLPHDTDEPQDQPHPGEPPSPRHAPHTDDTPRADRTTPAQHRPRPASGNHRPRLTRARVIARRRRRTSGLTLLLLATIVAVTAGLGPWWVLVPPTVLLIGHLALLRTAAKLDAERRRARIEQRRRRARERARQQEEAAQAEREAEIIELAERRNQVYDQYADAYLRAVGD